MYNVMLFLQCRLEALNQILEMLSAENDKSVQDRCYQSDHSDVTYTALLHSVHLQFVASCCGMNCDALPNAQLCHYQVMLFHG